MITKECFECGELEEMEDSDVFCLGCQARALESQPKENRKFIENIMKYGILGEAF